MKRGGQVSAGHSVKYFVLSFAIIIPLFRPRSIGQFGAIERVFYMGQVLFALALAFYILVRFLQKNIKAFSPIAWMVIVYKAWETLAIFRNGKGDFSTLVNAAVIIGSTILTEHMLRKAPLEYLSSLSFYTGTLILINNLSYFTGGFAGVTDATGNVVYFWSTRNHLSSLFFIAIISSFVISGMKRSKVLSIWNLFVLFNVLWGTFTFQSATTIAGIASYIILHYLFKKRSALYRPVAFYLGGLGLHIAIVLLRMQEVFAYIIEQLLHRSITMTGRTTIWDTALYSIIRSPFWGYGQSSIFSFSFARSELPAHNQFLDIGVVCGIPGAVIFLVLLFMAFWMLEKYKASMIARIISCSLLSYVVMTITESPNPYQPWFILLGMVSLIPELNKRYSYVTYKLSSTGILRRQRVKDEL